GILGGKTGIIYQNNNCFSFYIQPFVVIPVILGSYDTISYKNKIAVFNGNFILNMRGPNYRIFAILQCCRLSQAFNFNGCIRSRFNIYQWYLLEPTAIVSGF